MKYLVITMLISISLLLSGCGSKEYTCTKVENSNNIETSTEVILKKKSVDTKVTISTTANSEEKAKEVENKLKETNLYSSVKRDGTKVIAEYSKTFEGDVTDNDRKELEKDGYTCK